MTIALKPKILVVILIGIAFVGYTVKRLMFNPMSLLAAHKPPPVTVQAITVQPTSMPLYLDAVGSLQAAKEVTLAPEVAGRIIDLPFASGAIVTKGDIIMAMDDKVEDADLKKAEALLALAKVNLDRSKNLASKNVEAQSSLDQRQADYNQAAASVAQDKTRVDQKKVMASFDGEMGIFEPKINLGHYIQSGENIVTLTDRRSLRLNFNLPEQERPRLAVGQKILLTTDAYGDKTFTGILTSIDPQIKDQTRTVSVQATVDNKDMSLFPGMFAHVKVALSTKDKTLVVPETAIDYTLYGDSVFIIETKKEGPPTVRRQPIKIGQKSRNAVEVIEGLKQGDTIVITGQLKLDNGMPVQIDTGHPLPTLTNLKS